MLIWLYCRVNITDAIELLYCNLEKGDISLFISFIYIFYILDTVLYRFFLYFLKIYRMFSVLFQIYGSDKE